MKRTLLLLLAAISMSGAIAATAPPSPYGGLFENQPGLKDKL